MASIFEQNAITIDLKDSSYEEIEVKQLDTAILNFNIVNYGIAVDLTSYTIEFRCAIPTSPESYVKQTTGITQNASGGVQVTCIPQIVSTPGVVNCELRIYNSNIGVQISTFDISLIVKASVIIE